MNPLYKRSLLRYCSFVVLLVNFAVWSWFLWSMGALLVLAIHKEFQMHNRIESHPATGPETNKTSMKIKVEAVKEESRESKGVEYTTVTVREVGEGALIQFLDYSLSGDEKSHKGKLVGKVMEIEISSIRSIFAGRPQLNGRILNITGKAA